jgi:archaellum component FlaC
MSAGPNIEGESMEDEVKKLLGEILNRLGGIESRLDKVDARFDMVEDRLDTIEDRLDALGRNVRHTKQATKRIEKLLVEEVDRLSSRVADLERRANA